MTPSSPLRVAFCVALLLCCGACTDTGSLGDSVDSMGRIFKAKPPDPSTRMPALEARIYDLIQDARKKIDPKAKSLSLDTELVKIAEKRSAAMASTNSFDDKSGDPHVAATMLMNDDQSFQGLVGENVASQHFDREDAIDVDALAERFVEGWLNSKPHKENLAFPDYDLTGVGAAANGDTIYVTELFANEFAPASTSAAPSQATPVASPDKAKDDAVKPPLRGDIVPAGGH